MDVTFQVPMQYCSLQHRTLLLSPVTSTTGCCFCFGSVPLFFLDLFLHWSPITYWGPTNLGSSSFSVLYFCLFILFMGFSRQEYWRSLPFPSPVDHIFFAGGWGMGGAPKITADGDWSHEIKRCLFLRRKVMTNLDSILKSRDITLSTKVHLVKAVVFPVVMYECENWTIKKAEHWRIDAFELWCWRRLLRVPWLRGDPTSPSKRKSVLNIHWQNWCWSWNSNTLGTCCEELTHLKRPWCGKDWKQEKKGTTKNEMVGWHHRLRGHEFE